MTIGIACGTNSVFHASANSPEKSKHLESWIWDAACSFRGAKDAAKYKDYTLEDLFLTHLHQLMTAKTRVNRLQIPTQ